MLGESRGDESDGLAYTEQCTSKNKVTRVTMYPTQNYTGIKDLYEHIANRINTDTT